MAPLEEEGRVAFNKRVNVIRGIKKENNQITKVLDSGFVKDKGGEEILEVVLELKPSEEERVVEARYIKRLDNDFMEISENSTHRVKILDQV